MATAAPNTMEIDCINTIRTLAMDAVQAANSGHPGTPMALAPVMYTIWDRHLSHNPANPSFANRDRFVLSCGHASTLLYGALHLTGYDVSLDDIKSFRQLNAKCAGHPEYRHCPGVETTTGPLGQGLGNSVGMAIAERFLAARFNKPGFDLVSHRVIALCGDGDIMEGVGMEAASLAGHLKLSNLTWVYDANKITIDGGTDLCFSEDVAGRFKASGWHVVTATDANDVDHLDGCMQEAFAHELPTLVIVPSRIGFGSPNKENTSGAHGAPLGEEEIRLTKEALGCDPELSFHVPSEVKDAMTQKALDRGAETEAAWDEMFERYRAEWPTEAGQWDDIQAGRLPEGFDAELPTYAADAGSIASRKASGAALQVAASAIPWMVGGSADLAGSNQTLLKGEDTQSAETPGGRNVFFGIREHVMASIANGMALSGLRPFVSTFLVFSDYCRSVHRLSAMMGLPVIYVYTHDSIGVGEDGPTHQPIEHVASLRSIPGLTVIRPADANETTEAWRSALARTDGPTALILTRQGLPTMDQSNVASSQGVHRGAYVLRETEGGDPQIILMGTGSEVSLCMEAAEKLERDGRRVRVVSMPSWEMFEAQDASYRESVLPTDCRCRVAIEAGATFGWERYVGLDGRVIGRDDFGASAPAPQLFQEFGITTDAILNAVSEIE